MPYHITKTHIRAIDPNDERQLAGLKEESTLPLDDYLQQFPPRTMVMMFEPEFSDKKFLTWAYEHINHLYPGANFRYALVDHELMPVDPKGKTLSFPFMFIGLFDYKGRTYAGSFVGGHATNMLQVKGEGYPEPAINLEGHYREIFTAKAQQRLVLQSVEAIQNYPGISGVIAAVPNRRAGNNPALGKSAFFNLLTGGSVLDHYRDSAEFNHPLDTGRAMPENSLRAKPVSFISKIGKNGRRDPDKSYTYFAMLGNRAEELSDPEFCRLCSDIRNLGPHYQKEIGRPEGTRFDPEKGKMVVRRMVDLGREKG